MKTTSLQTWIVVETKKKTFAFRGIYQEYLKKMFSTIHSDLIEIDFDLFQVCGHILCALHINPVLEFAHFAFHAARFLDVCHQVGTIGVQRGEEFVRPFGVLVLFGVRVDEGVCGRVLAVQVPRNGVNLFLEFSRVQQDPVDVTVLFLDIADDFEDTTGVGGTR